jgi:hypothetical protein
MTTIASVVEGDGEVRALPVLIRTLAAVHGVAHVDVPRPFRLPRSKFLVPEEFARAIELQARRVMAGGVIAVLDADDDCAVELVDRIRKDYPGSRQFRLVAAVREYESIFLAGLTERDPESVRGAKELLRTATGVPYRETVHQAKLSAALDLDRARECRWFRKFEKELLAILRG